MPMGIPRRRVSIQQLKHQTNNSCRTKADRGLGGGVPAVVRHAGSAVAPNPHPGRAPAGFDPPPDLRARFCQNQMSNEQRQKKPSHIFISYVREDERSVLQLARDLRSFGFDVWLDKDNIAPGTDWRRAIREAI